MKQTTMAAAAVLAVRTAQVQAAVQQDDQAAQDRWQCGKRRLQRRGWQNRQEPGLRLNSG